MSADLLASPLQPIDIYTDAWPPYVNGEFESPGAVTKIVELALRDMRFDPQRNYVDFSIAYDMVRNAEVRLSYPYFKTNRRRSDDPMILFSAPIMEVETALYYSNTHNDFRGGEVDISQQSVGRVLGYAYGESFEPLLQNARLFQSEVLALKALLDGDIDLLPMTRRVGQALVLKHFPWRYHEFKAVPGEDYISRDSVHLITVNDEAGQVFIEGFNSSMAKLDGSHKQDEILETSLGVNNRSGYVRLVAGEGHPVVIGQTHKDKAQPDNRYVMIPQGSRALVLDWSKVVFEEFESPNLYVTMVELSLVRVVDGPHAGREFYVKNLHINIE